MEEPSICVGREVICKFHENQDRDNRNNVITRTLGKFGVVSTAWYSDKRPDQIPQPGEFWRVRIIKEVQAGQHNGCFVLEPRSKLPGGPSDIDKLLPGFYTMEIVGGVVIITPKKGIGSSNNAKPNWILPLAIKKEIKGAHAIIVDLV